MKRLVARRRFVQLIICLGVSLVAAGYAYAQFQQDFLDGFGVMGGEQGDPAELPPAQWPESRVPSPGSPSTTAYQLRRPRV